MKAKFVRQLSFDVALYECDPPMRFLGYSDDSGSFDAIGEASLVAAYSGQPVEGVYRTVLHAAEWCGDSVAYGGARGNRQFDANLTHEQAFRLAGYEIDDPALV